MKSKYAPLGAYLQACPTAEVPMSFSDIESVIGAALPPKAVNHPAWWSNNTSNNTMTQVWLDAGFRSERVDVGARRLVFRRVAQPPRPPREPGRPSSDAVAPDGLLSRMRVALAGTVRVAPGVDLCAPTGETWDAEQA
jgi:hypothetical protein